MSGRGVGNHNHNNRSSSFGSEATGGSSSNVDQSNLKSLSSSLSSSDVFNTSSTSGSSSGGGRNITTGRSVSSQLLNHPKVRALQTTHWDHSLYTLSIARTAFGASVVVRDASSTNSESISQETVFIAGGRGGRKLGSASSSVLSSIEVFDPSSSVQGEICQHHLNVARYSCGAFTVATNFMCVLGGKDQNNEYLCSVELVSDTSVKILSDMFSLPVPMACFGVATVSEKVFLFGGKSKESTLSAVYAADISYFVDASEDKEIVRNRPTTIWKKVGTLASAAGPSPQHSFSLVVDGDVCWLVGGFDGKKLLKSVGLYHTVYNKFMVHPLNLAVARSGLTSFALGNCIVVVGGIASAANNTTYAGSRTDYTTQKAVTAELLLRIEGEKQANKNEVFVAMPNLDCPQKDQFVFQIGYKIYAIGQYNFLSGEPMNTIPCMNIFDLQEAFNMDQRIDGIVVAKDFPMPVVPIEPTEPKMSPDVEKLKRSIGEWKKLIEVRTAEYIANVQEAASTSQRIYDQVVGSWMQEITTTNKSLDESNRDKQNIHDKEIMNSKIIELRREFERQKQKVEQETAERIQLRNKQFDAQRTICKNQVKKLETSIAEYGTRLQHHKDKMQSNLLNWINAKTMDISNMEGIISGTSPALNPNGTTYRDVDLSEDRRKIHRVFSGLDVEPVIVSKEYGRHCTNNYDVKNQIGVGGFGSVYQGNDMTLRCTFAFKRVSMTVDNPEKLQGVLKTFQREISTLKRVRHPNIVALYGYYMEPGSDNSFLIYELLDRGSLAVFLKNEEGRIRLPYLRRLRIMSETLRALNFLHTGGCAGLEIQHRDIKPHNICLAEDWSSKLIDCGLARIERIEEPSPDGGTTFFSSAYGLVGTDGYICRAYWNGMRPYQSSCDIYSFGVVMVELITGTLNRQNKDFPGDIYNQFIASISGVAVQNSLPKLMERCDEVVVWDEKDLPALCKLALQCLSLDVKKRPTAKTLVYEISKMLLRGEIGELPEEFTINNNNNDTPNITTTPCSVCNENRDHFVECRNSHTLCNQCIAQEALMASHNGNTRVKCPIMECRCTFDVRQDLYAIVPQDVYNKTTAEGRILEYLERIEKKQNRVISDISLVRKGVNRGLQAMASLTTSGNSPCPKLVWIIPGASIKASAVNPSTWVKGLTEVPVKVYFICEHSFTPVTKPVLLTVKKKWLRHVAPALKVTLFVLKLTTTLAGLPFPVANVGNLSEQVNMAAEFVDSLLDSDQCKMINRSETLFIDGVREFDSEQLKSLTGRAYDLLADGVRTGGQLTWQEELRPVLNENGATIWVKNNHASRYNLSNDAFQQGTLFTV